MMAQRPLLSGNCTAPQCAEHPHRRIVRTARKYSHGRTKRKRGKAAGNNYASAQSSVRKAINHDSNYIICTAVLCALSTTRRTLRLTRCPRFAAVSLVQTDALHASDLLPKMRIRFGLILKITVWTKSYIPQTALFHKTT